ncbi:hypothetical protein NC651_019104 [Populus alba x Populus x berolinensis]|nr:hypothetical protein NC651_019104 [Populus alba x Populus x berolinensis]
MHCEDNQDTTKESRANGTKKPFAMLVVFRYKSGRLFPSTGPRLVQPSSLPCIPIPIRKDGTVNRKRLG